jgi:cellulose synthase (UDP-forming)
MALNTVNQTQSAAPAESTPAPYRVRFVPLYRSALWRNAFYGYLVLTVVFMTWRCTVVNWHVWTGPVALAADLFGAVTFTALLWHVRNPTIPVHRDVDVTGYLVDCLIPTHTEPVEVIESTVLGALGIRGVRRVLVLGNEFRPEVRDMATRVGAEYHSRNATRQGKAGNLNAGLAHTDADYIITLDADHIPRPDLLERALGYFDDPAVALVQAPQTFYNTDCFAFRPTRNGLWSESQMFYGKVQPSKNHWNAAFYVGTSAVLRRGALDSTDGFGTGTITEDIHTALRLHAKGWRTVFLPEPVAFGLEASSLREFYSQRRRWALGSLQLLFRHRDSPLWRRGLNPAQRVHYVHATSIHLGGPQRLFQLALPALTLFTMTSPVAIPFSGYALVFLAFTALSWAMMRLYFGRAYHPVHSEAYSLVAALSQSAALVGVFRREQRFNAANKRASFGERTWVKTALGLLVLTCAGTVGYGLWLIAHGRHGGLIISATAWAAAHGFWVASILSYLVRYERRPVPPYQALTGAERVDWVLAHTVDQVDRARTELSTVDPSRLPVTASAVAT